MRLRPSPFVVPKSGDPFVNDTLDRKDQIEALTEILRNVHGPCVLAVDGTWGSGKTAFLKMWARFLRSKRFRVAEFNAWEGDFSSDPLMALYSALEHELGRLPTPKHKAALRAGAIVVSKLASTVPLVPDIAGVVDAATDRSDTSPEARLARHRDAEAAIRAFKKALAKVTKDRLPLIVCVDELDRCRPDYAIKFLEATKHVFNVDGVVFVLAVNLSELAKSVRVAYGAEFDGTKYLQRFVDRVVYLPKADRARFLDGLLVSVQIDHAQDRDSWVRVFLDTFLLGAPHMSLRDIEQSIYHLGMVLNAFRRVRHPVRISSVVVATVLLLFRMVAPDTYRQFTRGEISDAEALKKLNNLVSRDDESWKTSASYTPKLVGAKLESVLIGWSAHRSDVWPMDTPLIRQRRQEAEHDEKDYASIVLAEAESLDSSDNSRFEHIYSLIEMITYVPPSNS